MAEKWYNVTPEAAAAKLSSDLEKGLDPRTARSRLRAHGENDVFLMPGTSLADCVKAVGGDISAYLLAGLAIIAAIFKQNVHATLLIVLIAINFAATLIMYIRSRRVLNSMSKTAAPASRVLRDGKVVILPQSEVVVGDVVMLGAGDIVPADARVVESDRLYVFESELNGDPSSKLKTADMVYGDNVPPEGRTNMVFATSIVTSGAAKVLVCACGDDTLAAVTGKRKEIVNHKDLKVLKQLKKYCGIASMLMFAVIFVITVLDVAVGLDDRGLFNIFITAASLTVAAMTEFHVVFAYFIIGTGIDRALDKSGAFNAGAMIKNVSTLEDIKAIDTFIVTRRDGFYTDRSTITKLYSSGTLYKSKEKRLYNNCGRLVKYALLSTGYAAYPAVLDDPASEAGATVALAEKIGVDRMVLKADYPLLSFTDSYASLNADAAVVADEGSYVAVVRGEPVQMLGMCDFYYDEGEIKVIDEKERKKINEALRTIDMDGCRAIAVISRLTQRTDITKVGAHDFMLEGFLSIREPSLPGAEKTIAACKAAGVQVIVLTETEQDPSRIYFKRIGLVDDDTQIMTSSELSMMKDDLFVTNLPVYTMYEGLTLPQKRLLLRHLREEGRKVGVMGHELGDVLLLTEADVGFATAVTSSEKVLPYDPTGAASDSCSALRYTCDVLVSPPDTPRGGFNAMFDSLCTAKHVYQNLLRMVKYVFTSQMARLALVLYSVIAHRSTWKLSAAQFLSPVQILILGLIVDFAVICAIAYQPPSKNILRERENTEERLQHPLRSNFVKSVAFGVLWGAVAAAVPFILSVTGAAMPEGSVSTMVFVSFMLTQLVVACEVIYENSLFSPGNRFNKIIFFVLLGVAAIVGISLLIPAVGVYTGIVSMTWLEWLCAAAIPVVMFATYEIYKLAKKS